MWLSPASPPWAEDITEKLCARVVGQSEAIAAIVAALTRWKGGLAGIERPVAAFLLLGPTGVGKTLTVEALADIMHGSPRAFLKVNCAEFRSDHELARMKGAPPGYVGWNETVPLFHNTRLKDVRLKEKLALVLFDEMEKAHPALWELLLGILDKGEVVLNDNCRSDFRETLIFMTGNIGAREVAAALAGGMGFSAPPRPTTKGDPANVAHITERATERLLSPEFRNRLTATLTYHALSQTDMERVAWLEVAHLAEKMAGREAKPTVNLHVAAGVPEHLAACGYDARYGARHVRRAIERLLEAPLANILVSGAVPDQARIEVHPPKEGAEALRFCLAG